MCFDEMKSATNLNSKAIYFPFLFSLTLTCKNNFSMNLNDISL